MNYFYTKSNEDDTLIGSRNRGVILAVIRANFTSTSLFHDIVQYAVLRDSVAYGADEIHWDNAVAFNLCPCIEFDGKEFTTIHEPG